MGERENEVIVVSVLETGGLPGIAVPPGATVASRPIILAVTCRINF